MLGTGWEIPRTFYIMMLGCQASRVTAEWKQAAESTGGGGIRNELFKQNPARTLLFSLWSGVVVSACKMLFTAPKCAFSS